MTGKSHIIAGTALGICSVIGLSDLSKTLTAYCSGNATNFTFPQHLPRQWVSNLLSVIDFILKPITDIATKRPVAILFTMLAVLLFWFGTLLPDIDTETSLISRLFQKCRLNIISNKLNTLEHHVVTHLIWFALFVLIISVLLKCPVLGYLAFGYFSHLLLDSFGRMGVCWFVPDYIKYDSGARVKRGHFLKLYRTDGISEYICVALICAGTVFLLV